MKKSLIALAAFGAFAGAAQAESSVTLYGLLDTGVNYVTNAKSFAGVDAGGKPVFTSGHAYELASGIMQGSRWGLRGVEDLGNGLKAIFTLESGFDVNTGYSNQNDRLFGRQAFVGLAGDFGSVTVGRQYDSLTDFVGPLAASNRGAGDFAAHTGDVNNLNGTYRIDNAVKYTSANYDGVTFGGLYSLGGTAGSFSKNRVWSAGASFANGPLALGAAYLQAKNPASSYFGYTQQGLLQNINSQIDGFGTTASSLQVAAAGITYSFGPFTAGGNYSNVQFKDYVSVTNPAAKATLHIGEASLAYQFSPVLSGIVAANYTKGNSVNGNKGIRGKTLNLGLDYALSKRTDIYALAVGQNVSGTDSLGLAATGQIYGFAASDSSRQRAVRVGVRHAF